MKETNLLVKKGTKYNGDESHRFTDPVSINNPVVHFEFFFVDEEGRKIEREPRRKKVEGLALNRDYRLAVIIDESKVIHIVFEDCKDSQKRYRVSFADLLADTGKLISVKA